MAVLRITDQKGQGTSSAHYMAQLVRGSPRPLTLSELFLRGPGSRARLLLTDEESGGGNVRVSWHHVIPNLVNICAQVCSLDSSY